jgi:hypothetical protein
MLTAQLGILTVASGPDSQSDVSHSELVWSFKGVDFCLASRNPNHADQMEPAAKCERWIFLDALTGEHLDETDQHRVQRAG